MIAKEACDLEKARSGMATPGSNNQSTRKRTGRHFRFPASLRIVPPETDHRGRARGTSEYAAHSGDILKSLPAFRFLLRRPSIFTLCDLRNVLVSGIPQSDESTDSNPVLATGEDVEDYAGRYLYRDPSRGWSTIAE
jgi:hypothetical protein